MRITIILLLTCFSINYTSGQFFKGKLEYTFLGPSQLDMKINLMQNYRVKVKNISTTSVNDIKVFFSALNTDGSIAVPTNGFATFPQGQVNLNPGDSTIVQGWADGWKDCSNCGFISGINNKKIRFVFFLDTLTFPNTDRDTVIYDTKLLNNDVTTVKALSYVTNNGTFNIKATFKLPSYIKDSISSVQFFLQNSGGSLGFKDIVDSWQISPGTTSTTKLGDTYYNFDLNVISRSDWRIQAKATMKTGVTWFIPYVNLPIKKSGTQYNTTIQPYGIANFTIDSVKMYKTETGFWRGVFVPQDSSLVCFPGQENWLNGNDYKVNSRLYKIKLNSTNFGDTAWSYLIGDETWGGAASKDGRYVIYLLNQGGMDPSNVSKDWVAILDGKTGKKIWGSGGNLTFEYQGLEVGISKEGKYFGIGSTGANKITIFQNNHAVNGQSSVTKLWDYNCAGQIRKVVFTDDGKFVYVGSGDSYLRKFNLADGKLIWKSFIGSWPFVSGLQFSSDSTFIYTATKSFEESKINATTGEVIWTIFTGGLDVHVSSDGKYSSDNLGQVIDADGNYVGHIGNAGQKGFAYLNDFVITSDANIEIIHPFGNSLVSRTTNLLDAGGYSQFSWNDTAGSKLIVLSRDMLNAPPRNGIGTWKITPNINRYPTLDSIPNLTVNNGDSVYTILHYSDRDANTLSVNATSYSGNVTIRLGSNDTLWIKPLRGYSGIDTIKLTIKETNTIQKLSIYNLFLVTVNCPTLDIPIINSTGSLNLCQGQIDTLISSVSSANQWYFNGNIIDSATSKNFIARAAGVYTDTVTNSNGCKSGSAKTTIIINPLPSSPNVVDTIFCQNSLNAVLSATSQSGNSLLWYGTNATGGTATRTATIPILTDTITRIYYVSQTNNTTSCESPRSKITVKINPAPTLPVVKDSAYCQNGPTDTLRATASAGNSLLWYGTNATGGTATTTASNPIVTIVGTQFYYVSQKNTSTGCEGSRAKITITTNGLPTFPIVKDISYCQNQTADTLKATASSGNSLLWYGTNATGGTGNNIASIPATTNVGTLSYYVSQKTIATGCEGARSKIVVTTNAIPSPPTLSRDTSNYLVSTTYNTTWYKDGTALTDTTQKIKPTAAGSYTAKTTQNGCISTASSAYYYLVTDIINLENGEFIKLAPNPFQGNLNIDFKIKGYQYLNLEVFELATGIKVAQRNNVYPGTSMQFNNLNAGTYIIRVTSNDNKLNYQFKMVKL